MDLEALTNAMNLIDLLNTPIGGCAIFVTISVIFWRFFDWLERNLEG